MKTIRPYKFLFNLNNKDILILISLCALSLLFDFFWLLIHNVPPQWDQAFHLTNLYRISNTLDSLNLLDSEWWNQLWSICDTYRGPFTYIISSIIFDYLGSNYEAAILTNHIFNSLLIFSVYYLARLLHSSEAGLWAAFLCLVSPAFILQRTDYLIDFSLTAVINFTWLMLTLWYFRRRGNHTLLSIICGVLLGSIVLIRPTGLIFLWIPTLIIAFELFKSIFDKNFDPIVQIFWLSISFALTCFPWFSLNWLTIFTSINKARKWGILYQEGLEASTLEGWLYYPKIIPSMIGVTLFFVIIIGWCIFIRGNVIKKDILKSFFIKENLLNTLWHISFPFGGIVACIIMTTKDYRFFLPLLPQVTILLGILISSIGNNIIAYRRWKASLVVIAIFGFAWTQFGLGFNVTGFYLNKPISEKGWPLEEIIQSIVKESPFHISTLAVLPDSKYLNAFNLEAEGQRQNGMVAARQIVSNLENVADELSNFDWFLLKTGDQGVMSDDRQEKLASILNNSKSFITVADWLLPDKSHAKLLRRSSLTIHITRDSSCSNVLPSASINHIPGALEVRLKGQFLDLNDSRILIDLMSDSQSIKFDQSIAKGLLKFDPASNLDCIDIIQNYSDSELNLLSNTDYISSFTLLHNSGEKQLLEPTKFRSLNSVDYSSPLPLYSSNKVNILLNMGKLFREGNFDLLFDRVGQINQSDPQQVYLAESEKIFKARDNTDSISLDYLYSLALSQILQKHPDDAINTLTTINIIDPGNANAYLAKSISYLYKIKPRLAYKSLEKAKSLNQNQSLSTIITTLMRISGIMSFNFSYI